LTRILGLDCEMVGVGPDGSKSALARVVVVNAHGNSVLDTYVKPQQDVTDYRTAVSGVRPHHLQNAPGLGEVQTRVATLLRDRLVVGHALHNDLKALLLSHPRRLLRDTAKYPPLMRRAPHVGGPTPEARRGRAAKLQELAAEHLGLTIQMGEHSPVEDARAAVLLYHKFAREWERWLRKGGGHRKRSNTPTAAGEHEHGAAAAAEALEGEHAGGASQQRWKRKREELHAVSARKEAKKRHGDGVNKKTGDGGGGWSALLQRASSRGGE
jgi:RNA exonuclease 4